MDSIYRLEVRTYECDSNAHVNNAVYLNYYEAARYQFLMDIGFDYHKMVEEGFAVYIARAEIDYVRSAEIGDKLVIYTRPWKKGAVSGTLEQEIYNSEDKDPKHLVSRAHMKWAIVDFKTRHPVRIPPEFDVPGLKPDSEQGAA
jgi:YbgC/YbaW family acyl-CoA thioester hydrolase